MFMYMLILQVQKYLQYAKNTPCLTTERITLLFNPRECFRMYLIIQMSKFYERNRICMFVCQAQQMS